MTTNRPSRAKAGFTETRGRPSTEKKLRADLSQSEDLCRFCGAHVGYGIKFLHIRLCDNAECQRKARNERHQEAAAKDHLPK